MLFYLRLVHSVDYYGTTWHELENSEPKRIGIMTVRSDPTGVVATPKILHSYIQQAEEALSNMFPAPGGKIAEEHIELLGKRGPDEELKRIRRESIQHLWRDKLWKCNVCYKRFTSERFAEEHFEGKHVDKLKEAHVESDYYNGYIADPQRPYAATFH